MGAELDAIPSSYAHVCEGRLTLASGVPVTTKAQLYWTPYKGNRIALYVNGEWVIRTYTEKTVVVPATVNTPFDIFAHDSTGTMILDTVNWTNGTTRATPLALQDGIYVKGGDPTRRYLGTGATTGSTEQTEDSAAKRYLWNYYNRVEAHMLVLESTDTWVYSSPMIRQARWLRPTSWPW